MATGNTDEGGTETDTGNPKTPEDQKTTESPETAKSEETAAEGGKRHGFHPLAWERRLPKWALVLRHVLRVLVFTLVFWQLSRLAVIALQWGANADETVGGASPASASDLFAPQYVALLKARANTGYGSVVGGRWQLNVLCAMVIYLVLITLVNRFWVGTGLFMTLMTVFAVATRIKVALRHEPVLPTDLSVAGSIGGQLGSFVTAEQSRLIGRAVLFLLLAWVACLALRVLLGQGKVVWIRNVPAHIGLRLLAFAVPTSLLVTFVLTVGTYQSPAYWFARAHGDNPEMWSTLLDAQDNGVLVSFLRLSHPRVMTRPEGYSSQAMREIADTYSREAKRINRTRKNDLTDMTVINVLSESFSDPLRVPGITLNKDPMPNIRALKSQTTSGLMLSSGYGGGTANLEFQELTGISTALLDPTLNSPYVQLVPRATWTYSHNQLWNEATAGKSDGSGKSDDANSGTGSLAIHPYTGRTYGRANNFRRKFLFCHFYTQDGPERITHDERIDRNPYVSDAQAYQEVLDRLSAPENGGDSDRPKDQLFVQLSTMQNHPRYQDWYDNNEFRASSTTSKPMTKDEATAVQTYSKGVSHTDTATRDWLEKMDRLKRPIIVVWYGDHLPGAYSAEVARPSNTLAMHETDYFIWANAAARKAGALTRLPQAESAFTSPNFFVAETATQADAKVSPYIAFLTRMHEQIAAMEPTISTARNTNWSTIGRVSPTTYLDHDGTRIPESKLTRRQISMLHTYRLIEYDMTIGRHYLQPLGFTELP